LCGASAKDNTDTDSVGVVVTTNGGTAQPRVEIVVVTAEKRVESSQNVPVALTALSGSALDSQGIVGFKELGMRVPSLRFGSGVTGGENVITMRGLGSQNTTPGGDSPVAYSVDGVTLQRSTSVDPEFYDIDHIEVLRGPQGTLYGRNSVGGSVNVITRKPSDTLSGGGDVLLGDYDAHILRGWVNAPLMDDGAFKVYARLTGVWSQHDPYSKNLSTAPTATHNQNGEDFYLVRGQLYVEFNPDLNLLLSASANDQRDPVSPTTAWWETPARYVALPPSPIPLGSACDFSTPAKYQARTFCHDAPENAYNRVNLYSATLNWNLDWATLTSVFGYGTSEVSQTSDGDGSDLPMALGSIWVLNQHQLSEEVRLASNDDASPLKWIAGFYFFYANNYENFAYSDLGLNDVFPVPGIFDTFNFLSHGNTKTRSWAPFGQVDYDLAKTSIGIPLTITLGARYTNDEKYGTNYLDYQLPLFCPGPTGTCLLVPNVPFTRTWGQWTGKGGLTYRVNDRFMVYASAARGYIAGGNIVGLPNIYDPESAWSYDAGFKSQFWDDRAQLNVAVYHEEITHLQVFIQSSTQSGINNVDGLTQANGIETELTLVPIDNLRLNAAVTVTHATYGKYITTDTRFGGPGPGCDAITLLCNFKGHWLNQTPPYTIDLGAEYGFVTSFGTITPRVDAFFSGKVQFLPDNYFTSTQKAYHLTNLRLTWVDPDSRWKAEAFVENVEDEDVISNDGLQSITLGQQGLEPDNFVYYPPRTFGVRVGVNF